MSYLNNNKKNWFDFAPLAFILLVTACSSCQPNSFPRPDSPVCTVTEVSGECTDNRGDFNLPHGDLMCTSLDGYLNLEKYVDDLEREVIKLRRRCK